MPQGQLGVEVVPERIANAQTLGDFKDGFDGGTLKERALIEGTQGGVSEPD